MSMSSREMRQLDNWITREPDPDCLYHEGMSALDCTECEAEYEAYQENLMDEMRLEQRSRD